MIAIVRVALVVLLLIASATVCAQTAAEQGAPAAPAKPKLSVQGSPVSPQQLVNVLTTVNAFLAELQSDGNAPGYDLLAADSKKDESEDQWNELIDQMREQAGDRLNTTFAFALQTDDLPNAAKRHYVVIGLNSSFQKAKLSETLILVPETGQYRIAGYHFQSRNDTPQP